MDNTKKVFGNSIKYSHSIENAITDCDCIIIMTEWDEYKEITQKQITETNRNGPVLVLDTRRFLNIKKTKKIDYVALGRNTSFHE